jgi:hypothetical protein
MFSLAMVPLYAAFLTAEDIDDAAKLIARLRSKGTVPSTSTSASTASVAKS